MSSDTKIKLILPLLLTSCSAVPVNFVTFIHLQTFELITIYAYKEKKSTGPFFPVTTKKDLNCHASSN
jgi:hypothetical protein